MNSGRSRCWALQCGRGIGLVLIACAGCAYTPNFYRETGPSVSMAWDSPTAEDVISRFEPAELRARGWQPRTVAVADGAVGHYPLYFEDPFEDKGHGRTDATHPRNVYRLGWEDWIAFPYCYARYTLNWLMLPASAIVTPPWTPMESDGYLSRQMLGYDHDARPVVPWPGCGTPESDSGAEAPPPVSDAPEKQPEFEETSVVARVS